MDMPCRRPTHALLTCLRLSLPELRLLQGTPFAIKLATVVGMGLLIALIGMVSIKIVVSNPQVLSRGNNRFILVYLLVVHARITRHALCGWPADASERGKHR